MQLDNALIFNCLSYDLELIDKKLSLEIVHQRHNYPTGIMLHDAFLVIHQSNPERQAKINVTSLAAIFIFILDKSKYCKYLVPYMLIVVNKFLPI
jgi:hypothetical protein